MIKPREIRLVINGGKHQTYYPGARISGEVIYKTMTNEKLQSVSIDLRGTEKVLPTKGSPIKSPEFIEVFHFNEILQKSPVWTEGPDRSDMTKFYGSDSGNILFDVVPHALAPTLKKHQSQAVRVEYEMYTVAVFGMKTFGSGGNLAAASICDLIDTLYYSPDLPGDVYHETTYKDIEFPLGQYKVKPSLINAIRRGSRTSITSRDNQGMLVARLPGQMVVDEDVNVTVHLREAAAQDRSSCLLKQSTVLLRSLTHHRTKDCAFDPAFTETNTTKLVSQSMSCVLSGNPSTLTFTPQKLKDWPSSFRSYSIARSYELILQMKVVIGNGKDRSEEFAEFVSEIQLLRRADEAEMNRRRQANMPPPSLEPHSVPIEEDELPTYDHHEDHVLIGRGEALDGDETLESLTAMRILPDRRVG